MLCNPHNLGVPSLLNDDVQLNEASSASSSCPCLDASLRRERDPRVSPLPPSDPVCPTPSSHSAARRSSLDHLAPEVWLAVSHQQSQSPPPALRSPHSLARSSLLRLATLSRASRSSLVVRSGFSFVDRPPDLTDLLIFSFVSILASALLRSLLHLAAFIRRFCLSVAYLALALFPHLCPSQLDITTTRFCDQ